MNEKSRNDLEGAGQMEQGTENQGTDNQNTDNNQQQQGFGDERVEAQEATASSQGTNSLEAQLADAKDRYLRLAADFENFKRRTLKEQSELLKYQGERIVVDLLEVIDNLELALNHSSANQESLKTGLDMVYKLFVERLGKWQIRGESSVGARFDPQKHAAISRVPGSESGVIVGELKKPYYYKDKLIRCGEVVVATAGDESR